MNRLDAVALLPFASVAVSVRDSAAVSVYSTVVFPLLSVTADWPKVTVVLSLPGDGLPVQCITVYVGNDSLRYVDRSPVSRAAVRSDQQISNLRTDGVSDKVHRTAGRLATDGRTDGNIARRRRG